MSRRFSALALCGALVLVQACGETGAVLGQIAEEGELVVLTRNAPTTWYIGRDGAEGFEHDLTQAFAEALGVGVRYEVRDTIEEVLAGLLAGDGHLAAAGLTRTEGREGFRFGPDYYRVQQQVVCHRQGPVPTGAAELAGVSLLTISGSSYVERLAELRAEHPELTWEATDALSTEQVLERVWEREADCAVADSNIVAINRRYYPELVVAFPLTETQSLAWVLPPGAADLEARLAAWFEREDTQELVDLLTAKHYGHIEIFDFVDTRAFTRRIESRLPRYRELLEAAAREYDLPWTILAAQAYQESHWDPLARSPTGVRGLMMLTSATAEELGVEDRLDPRQSVLGGARYLRRLMDRLPESIPAEQRLWFALAAYNVGYGHLTDARILTERLGKDPDSWYAVQSVLPLLSQKQHYRTLKYGYARGSEPARYIDRIRHYADILETHLARAGEEDAA